jgi:hypothetical protein
MNQSIRLMLKQPTVMLQVSFKQNISHLPFFFIRPCRFSEPKAIGCANLAAIHKYFLPTIGFL